MSVIVSEKIITYISKLKVIKTKQLQDELNIPFSTLRRYLIELEQKKIIKRNFGEIIFLGNNEIEFEGYANYRLGENVEIKKRIALEASKLVSANTQIFLDAGSSCYFLLDYLDKKTTIYTNSILNINRAIELGFVNLYLLGGKIKSKTLSIVEINHWFLNHLLFPIAFIGANAIDKNGLIYTPDQVEGETKLQIINKSKKIVVLIEKEKFNKTSFFNFTPHDKVFTVVTNHDKNHKIINNKVNFIYI